MSIDAGASGCTVFLTMAPPSTALPRTPEIGERRSEISELRPSSNDAGQLDELAREIAALGAGTTQAHIVRLGEIVHRGLQRSRGGLGEGSQASLRRLAAHPLVPFKVTSLWRAVSVYEMSLRLPHLVDHRNLNISHLRAVLGLPTQVQEELLRGAIEGRWTKRVLEQRAAIHRRAEAPRGRRPNSKWMVIAREVERLVERARELTKDDFQGPSGEREAALAAVDELRRRLAAG